MMSICGCYSTCKKFLHLQSSHCIPQYLPRPCKQTMGKANTITTWSQEHHKRIPTIDNIHMVCNDMCPLQSCCWPWWLMHACGITCLGSRSRYADESVTNCYTEEDILGSASFSQRGTICCSNQGHQLQRQEWCSYIVELVSEHL